MNISITKEQKQQVYDQEFNNWSQTALISSIDWVTHEIQRTEGLFEALRKKQNHSREDVEQWIQFCARLDALNTAIVQRFGEFQ